jgi:NB-ARC domain
MDAKEIIRLFKAWVKRKKRIDLNLDTLEETILEYSLKDIYYSDMNIIGYDVDYIKRNKGPDLFIRLTDIIGEKVTKKNCSIVLTKLLEQNDEEINESITNPDFLPINLHNAPYINDFYGRSQELGDLETWIIRDRCRLVGIFGMTGIGKTELVKKLVENIKQDFKYVIWKSLEDFPSLEETLTDIESRLSYVNTETNINRRIQNLIDCLNLHRCLLIFDQWEEVIRTTETPKDQHKNCKDHEKLLQKIVIEPHQSCFVFTSQIKPVIKELFINIKTIREFSLSGLENQDAKTLLEDFGLSNPGLNLLIDRYTGHPLALKIAARIIKKHHSGKIDQFLEGTAFMADIFRLSLDKQFSYLSKLEINIMQKLATEKEPKLLSQLYQYFPSNFQSEIIQAVDNLCEIRFIEQESIQDSRTLYSLNPLIERYIRKHYNN